MLSEVPDAQYPPPERLWPVRLIAYQVGLISARSLSLWGENDLPRVWRFLQLHGAANTQLQLRCHLAELDTWHSLARQGIIAGEKNENGSFEEGGQWLSIALTTASMREGMRGGGGSLTKRFDLEHLWLERCDTTGATALDGPGMYSGGTTTAVDAAEAKIDSAVATLHTTACGEVSRPETLLHVAFVLALYRLPGPLGPDLRCNSCASSCFHQPRQAKVKAFAPLIRALRQAQGFVVNFVLLGQGLKALTQRRGQFGPHPLSGIMMKDMHHEAREHGLSFGEESLNGLLGLGLGL